MKSVTQKREEAIIRQTAYNALTLDAKIAKAKTARGESTKQRMRLAATFLAGKKSENI